MTRPCRRSVAHELRRRGNCRDGLRGVLVSLPAHAGLYRVLSSRREDDGLWLCVRPQGATDDVLAPASPDAAAREKRVLICRRLADVAPEPFLRGRVRAGAFFVPAAEATLASAWPRHN